jgi:Bifunctional DNA primase/polymerase, N-terminal/Primase C terminal 2 (PriCT-2)/Family of unknown function (DUF5906)
VGPFQEYVQAGWALCIIPRGSKDPHYAKWNERPIDLETAAGIDGAGLLHVQSQTCALDIDDLPTARLWLAERGVDVDALLKAPEAVRISSGRPGRAKLLYRLKTPLRTFKPTGSGLELRCANLQGRSVQDVLPPSVHPDTHKAYEWVYGEPLLGDWARLPAIPAALKAAWRALIDDAPPQTNGHAREPVDIALEKLHAWIVGQDPNMDYDRWYKVGAKLHHATQGAEEGLAIWDSWSAKATRKDKYGKPVYKGIEDCRPHWVSFSSPPGKVVATLDHELPAGAEEFEVVPEVSAADATTESKMRETAKQQKLDAIAQLEKRVVYVLASEKYFDTSRHQLIGSDSALEHQFTSLMPRKNGKRINPVIVLKQSSTKRLVQGLGFHPGEGALFQLGADTFANLYRNRLPTPLEPTKPEREKIEWIFARIDDPLYRQWLKQYFAHVVQRPSVKIKTAPLLWSETERNGKSTLLKSIPALLVGREFSTDVGYDALNSAFNDYLQGAWHVNLTEFRAGTRGERAMINSKLKAYIADDTVQLHPKGSRAYEMPNHFFVTASSNEEDAAAINNNDQRWGIHEMKMPEYTESERQWIYHQFLLIPRAAAVLRYYFLHINLEGFYAAGSPPMTEAKREMAAASMPIDTEILTTLFEERAEFFAKDVVLTSDVVAYVQRTLRFISATRIGRILAKAPFNGIAKRLRIKDSFHRAIIIRNHQKWDVMRHTDIMEHVQGGDDDLDIMS